MREARRRPACKRLHTRLDGCDGRMRVELWVVHGCVQAVRAKPGTQGSCRVTVKRGLQHLHTFSQPRAAGLLPQVLPLAAESRTAALKTCGTGASVAVTAAASVHKIQKAHSRATTVSTMPVIAALGAIMIVPVLTAADNAGAATACDALLRQALRQELQLYHYVRRDFFTGLSTCVMDSSNDIHSVCLQVLLTLLECKERGRSHHQQCSASTSVGEAVSSEWRHAACA